jgi:hypothetical protein
MTSTGFNIPYSYVNRKYLSQALVAHAYNPSYPRGRDEED